MIKKVIFGVIFTIFFFCLFLVYLAPANKLFSLVDLPKDVKIYDVKGDLWNGHISVVEVKKVRISNIDWKLNFFTLLFSHGISLNVQDKNLVQGDLDLNIVGFSIGITELNNVNIASSIESLFQVIPDQLPFKAEGKINLNFNKIILNQQGLPEKLDGTAKLQNVLVTTVFIPDIKLNLGDIKANVTGNAKNINIIVEQDSVSMHFKGTISIDDLKKWSINGSLRPKGALPPSLGNIIATLGTPDANGLITVKFNGTF